VVRREQCGEHVRRVAGGSDFQVEDRAVEVETEVEERAAILLGGGEPGYGGSPAGGHGQPHPAWDSGGRRAADGLTPGCGTAGHVPSGK